MKIKLTPARRRTPRLKVRRILVPVDFSEMADKALAQAVPLATLMGAKILLLHVIEPVYAAAEPGLGYIPQDNAALEKEARAQMGKMAAKFIPEPLFDKAVCLIGNPAHEIAEAAKSLKAGLIVIPTHGRTGLSHILMGSTAEHVVRYAHCPVLTVPRSKTR